jgi:hypothetical protein
MKEIKSYTPFQCELAIKLKNAVEKEQQIKNILDETKNRSVYVRCINGTNIEEPLKLDKNFLKGVEIVIYSLYEDLSFPLTKDNSWRRNLDRNGKELADEILGINNERG